MQLSYLLPADACAKYVSFSVDFIVYWFSKVSWKLYSAVQNYWDHFIFFDIHEELAAFYNLQTPYMLCVYYWMQNSK